MENDLREQLERFKVKAETFLKNNTRAFIVDINDHYYFCDILLVGDGTIFVQSFKETNAGEKSKIYWSDIIKFEEYKEREG